MNKGIGIAAFLAGAAVGGIFSWLLAKRKYKEFAQEEIADVKAAFTLPKSAILEEQTAQAKAAVEKPDIRDYTAKLRQEGYSLQEEKGEDAMTEKRPYVIAPEAFGDMDGYETVSLTYYNDGVLTDDNDIPLEDMENIVGSEALTHFGEYEDDSVFVRNDRLKTDFEILLDQRDFADVT